MQQSRSAPFAVFGCGGFGREVVWMAVSDPAARHRPVCFVDDAAGTDTDGDRMSAGDAPERVADLPVLSMASFVEHHRDVPLIVSIGAPRTRRRIAERLVDAGLDAATLVHDRVRLAPSVSLGAGSILCDGVLTTVDIAIGRHVHVNLGCTLGHDVRIDDFVTLSPGVHVSGNVIIENGAFLGTGAAIINGTPEEPLVIGADSVIGAGAVVTASTAAGGLYVGVPARQPGAKRLR